MYILKVVAFNARRRREALHLTQDQVAAKAGVSRPAVARLEGATNAGIKMVDVFKIAEALRCGVGALVDDSLKLGHTGSCGKNGPCDCGRDAFMRWTNGQ